MARLMTFGYWLVKRSALGWDPDARAARAWLHQYCRQTWTSYSSFTSPEEVLRLAYLEGASDAVKASIRRCAEIVGKPITVWRYDDSKES